MVTLFFVFCEELENLLYPVRNNAPLLPPGQRPSLRGRSPSGAEPGPAAAAGSNFRIIPVGFNVPLEFLTGFIFNTFKKSIYNERG